MPQDKFKSVTPTIQIYKDGEAVSARKLDAIVRDTQEGFEDLEKAVGDIEHKQITFDGLPLFHNSLGRAMGPMDQVTLIPLRVFGVKQNLGSQSRGLLRSPWSSNSAIDLGNRSLNLLPDVDQTNKIGIGCTADNGQTCLNRFDDIYKAEKTVYTNALFTTQLSGWQTSGVLYDGSAAELDIAHRYNMLPYSESFRNWALTGDATVFNRAITDPNGTSNGTMIEPDLGGTSPLYIGISGGSDPSSTNWTLSVWAAASGETDMYIGISGATAVSGSLEGGAEPNQRYWTIHLSGNEFKRYYVHGQFSSAQTTAIAHIGLGVGNDYSATPLYIWGAQLEPTKYPSDYRQTTGSATSGLVSGVSISRRFDTVPGHIYQISVEFSERNGTTQLFIDDALKSNITATSHNTTFQAVDSSTMVTMTCENATAVSTTLSEFRVDPGTPCHAMNCPGFSAYGSIRGYRATLPTITIDDHQYYGTRLKLPDEVDVAQIPELPTNLLGIFDHEQNQTVPDHLVEWFLSSWNVGSDIVGEVINDPDFLTDWKTVGTDELPDEFGVYTSGTGLLSRATRAISLARKLSQAVYPYMTFDDTDHLSNNTVIPKVDFTHTTECFVRMPSGIPIPGNMRIILLRGGGKGVATTPPTNYELAINNAGGVYYRHHRHLFHADDTGFDVNPTWTYNTTDIRDGEWHHIAAVKRKVIGSPYSRTWIYQDGVLVASGYGTGPTDSAWDTDSSPLRVASAAAGVDPYWTSGSIRQIAMFRGERYPTPANGAIGTSYFTPPNDILPSGDIVFFWTFGEGAGAQELIDIGPSGYVLYPGGGAVPGGDDPTWVPSGSIYGLEFEAGTNDQMVWYSGTGSEYALNGHFTIEALMRGGTEAGTGNKNHVVTSRYSGDSINWLLGTNNDGTPFFRMASATSGELRLGESSNPGYWQNTTTDIVDNTWHYITIEVTKTANGPLATMYIDGTFEASGIASGISDWNWDTDGNLANSYLVTIGQFEPGAIVRGELVLDHILISSGVRYGADHTVYQPIRTSGLDYGTVHANWRMNHTEGTLVWDYGHSLDEPLSLAGANGPDWFVQGLEFTPSTEPTDILIISGTSGAKGISKVSILEQNTTYTWRYRVRGEQTGENTIERYEVASGTAQVDTDLTQNWVDIPTTGITNAYRVDGTTHPGAQTWAKYNAGWWEIKRRVRTTSPGAVIKLTLTAEDDVVEVDYANIELVNAESSRFEFDCAPALGLNWEGFATHVLTENLLANSENPELWQFTSVSGSSAQVDPEGGSTAVILFDPNGYIIETIPGNTILDPTLTVSLYAKTNIPAPAQLVWQQTDVSQPFTFNPTSTWQRFSFVVSGANHEASDDASVKIVVPVSGELEVWHPQVVHGSGTQNYVATYGRAVRTYRHKLRPTTRTLDTGWAPSYGLVETRPIQTQVQNLDPEGKIWAVEDSRNFPEQGVIEIRGQEYGYRIKGSTYFADLIQGWRGTSIDPESIQFNDRVTNVALPAPIKNIETSGQVVEFDNRFAAPVGGWADSVSLQIYNTHVSNLDRFSLQASAVPLTRAVGNLLTSFAGHVEQHRRHFRLSRLCDLLINSSSWCAMADIEAVILPESRTVEELNDTAIVDILAKRFLNRSDKEITLNWGDGTEVLISGGGSRFLDNSHVYDLKGITDPVPYTIKVVITDVDLDFSRSAATTIFVTPIATKTSANSSAKMKLQTTTTATSSAKMKAKIFTSSTSSAKIVLP